MHSLESEEEREPGAGCQQVLSIVGCCWAGQAEWLPIAPEMWTSACKLALLSLAAGNLTTQQPSCWEGSDICFKFFTGWDTFYNTQPFCKV